MVQTAVGTPTTGNGQRRPWIVTSPRWLRRHLVAVVLLDATAAALATIVAKLLSFGLDAGILQIRHFRIPYTALAIASVPTWLAVLALTGCYDLGPFGTAKRETVKVIRAGANFLAVVAVGFFVLHIEKLARGFLATMVPLAVAFSLAFRSAIHLYLRSRRRRGHAIRRAVVAGDRPTVIDLLNHFEAERSSGIEVVGACVPGSTRPLAIDGLAVPVVGGPDAALEALRDSGADTLIISGNLAGGRVRTYAWALEGSGVDVFVVPTVAQGRQLDVRPVAGLPLLYVDPVANGSVTQPEP